MDRLILINAVVGVVGFVSLLIAAIRMRGKVRGSFLMWDAIVVGYAALLYVGLLFVSIPGEFYRVAWLLLFLSAMFRGFVRG